MSLLEQLVKLLTQPPDSIVYYVVILLAVQVAFGLAWWQTRRSPRDTFARRMMWAAAGIFITRLGFLIITLLVAGNGSSSPVLPPLERAVDAMSSALLVWALVPHISSLPRLPDIVLLLVLVIIVFMYAALANQWEAAVSAFSVGASAEGGATLSYANSPQATLWDLVQLFILGSGIVLVILGRQRHFSLRLMILSLLFLAHVASLLWEPRGAPTAGQISFWVRLGNMVAFTLFAVLAYRHQLAEIVPSSRGRQGTPELEIQNIQLARRVISTPGQFTQTMQSALQMANQILPADFVALAIRSKEISEVLDVYCLPQTAAKPEQSGSEGREDRKIKLKNWPAIRLSMQQKQQVELVPNGLGARQLYELYQQLDIVGLGPLLIEPLVNDDNVLGVLLLAAPADRETWTAESRTLSISAGAFLAQALANAMAGQDQEGIRRSSPGEFELSAKIKQLTSDRDQSRLAQATAAKQLDELKEELNVLQLENQRLGAERSRSLSVSAIAAAGVLASAQDKVTSPSQTHDGYPPSAQEEIDRLRLSLTEAQRTLAMLASKEQGLNPDWVVKTVSRYSGQLEEAQARVSALESQLTYVKQRQTQDLVLSQTRSLRTPLTSISGYTDLLLHETPGFFGPKQITLLQRIKTNAHQISLTLDKIEQAARLGQPELVDREIVRVNEIVEKAINAVRSQLRAKRLRLDLEIEGDIPPIPTQGDDFFQIVLFMLKNACQVSEIDSQLGISIRIVNFFESSGDRSGAGMRFLNLAVTDGGGDRSQRINSLIMNTLRKDVSRGELTPSATMHTSMHKVLALTAAYGGRTWIQQEGPGGCSVSILLPVDPQQLAVGDQR